MRRHRGRVHIFGLEVNLNTILTTMFGSLACILLSWSITRLGTLTKNWNTIYKHFPIVEQELAQIQAEQARIRKQYSPPVVAQP